MSVDATTPWLTTRARVDGDAEAIRFGDARITWAELASQAEAVAARLASLGVVRGDIVAARMAPHARLVTLLHAAQMLGAALLPINLRLTAAEQQRILAHASPRLLIDDDASSMRDTGVDGALRAHAFDDAVATKSFVAPSRIDPQAPLTIVYTSGTTAAPKAVVLTNANHAASAAASRARFRHGRRDTWLGTLPLFHVGGLAILARSVMEGSRVLLEAGFDVDRTAALIASGEATMISVVPTMLARVLDRMESPASARLRCVLVGGAALSPSLGRRALDAGLPISATWGMTEACSQICSTAPGSDEAARGLVGRSLDGIEVVVTNADAEGWGELLVRGSTVMKGYLRNEEADRAALRGGWLATGDIGRVDEHGTVAVAGRRDDLIVTGGENVAPLEVEQVIDEHPDIAESMVVGQEDAEWGQRIVALVVARGDRCPPSAELEEWCRARIASYKIPREFRFAGALPRGATGKLLRPIR